MGEWHGPREREWRFLLRVNMTYKVTECWNEDHQLQMAEGYLNGAFNDEPSRTGCGRMCFLSELLHHAVDTLLSRAVTDNKEKWSEDVRVYFDHSDCGPVGIPRYNRWAWRFDRSDLKDSPSGYRRLTLHVPLTVFSARPREEWERKLRALWNNLIGLEGDDKDLAGELFREVIHILTRQEGGVLTAVSHARFLIWVDDEDTVQLQWLWNEHERE